MQVANQHEGQYAGNAVFTVSVSWSLRLLTFKENALWCLASSKLALVTSLTPFFSSQHITVWESTPELTCGQYQKRPKPVIFITISTSWKWQKSTKWKKKKARYLEIRQKAHKRFWANDKAALVWLKNTIWRNIAQDGFLVSNLPWTPV